MWKFILCSFAFLGWGFYELSGGGDFEPPKREVRIASALSTYDITPEQAESRMLNAAPSVAEPAVAVATNTAAEAEDVNAALVTASLATGTDLLENYDPEATTSASDTPAPQVTVVEDVPEEEPKDMREVTANRVNMRNGPSTRFQVLGKLTRGQEVEILQDPGDGWVKLRVQDTGKIGWMAARLLTAAAN